MVTRLESGRLLLNEMELRKFYSFCTVDPVPGCWNWTGGKYKAGYGRFYLRLGNYEYKLLMAHVVSYNHFVGTVPIGKELGHYNLPGNVPDKCASYEHVRPVTRAENMAEVYGHAPDVCNRGHDTVKWGRSTYGSCRACNRISAANHQGTFRGCLCCGYMPCRCDA